ncbi:MAG TPA: glutamate 5-kinase [Victivallales bacterium]|nr:glutamate 5-kinase [Victivallales bacterium]
MTDKNIDNRKELFDKASRIVIKVGTRLLTDIGRIGDIVSQIAFLKKEGREVILVSSGAVGLGMRTLEMKRRPSELSDVQALAAIGQSKLMSIYEKECSRHGFHCAQLLLGADDLRDRVRHLNIMNCLNSLLSKNILPVINENDTVSVDELKFGDNDTLAALIAVMTKADLTVILTTVEGLMTSTASDGELIPVVKNIDQKTKKLASGTADNQFSIGGMSSKIKAAEIVTKAGEPLVIADGRDPLIIKKIFNGEKRGTIFLSVSKQMSSKKRWLGFFSKSKGRIFVDEGAATALLNKGKSLLPTGIKSAEGDFKRGDTVDIYSISGDIIGKGLSNYSALEVLKMSGRKSSEAKSVLGYQGDDEIVHCDNMTIIG